MFLNHRNSALDYKIESSDISILTASCYNFLVILKIVTVPKALKNCKKFMHQIFKFWK